MTERTCAERIEEHYNNTLQYIHTASEYFNLDKEERESHPEHASEYCNYEDFFDCINQYGLSWDYVCKEDDPKGWGFYRWQLSWGGPSDEFRIYTKNEDTNEIDKIEYRFHDWFDGAGKWCSDSLVKHCAEMFLECEVKMPYEHEQEAA